MTIRNIPAGVDFLGTLAEYLRAASAQSNTALSDYTVLLPTRRAVRTLQQLLSPANGAATLLPRIYAIGDLDDDVLTLHLPDLEMPPVIHPTARLGLLIGLIQEQQEMPWARAEALAEALAKLLDEAALREVSLTALENLVPEDFAAHWGISLNWLRVIIQRWPQLLAERGQIDAACARQNILNGYVRLWSAQPPAQPIIAAGSTGSLPATRRILKCIAALPRGMVILPALDQNLPDEVWQDLPETHPQRPLYNLLTDFDIARDAILPLTEKTAAPEKLWQQVLLPAAATYLWRDPKFRLIKPDSDREILSHIHTCTAPNAEAEAAAITLIMQRAAVENKTAALITPDRTLAQRVSAQLQRFDIHVNDSAGQSLADAPPGRWVRQYLHAAENQFDAISLLSLLKHPLSCFGLDRGQCRAAARDMEYQFFRARNPLHNLAELLAVADGDLPLRAALSHLKIDTSHKTLAEWVHDLQDCAEKLTALPGGEALIFTENASQELEKLFGQLILYSEYFPEMSQSAFAELLYDRMQQVTLHGQDTHPRLQILGPLEARLHSFDIVILGGLNETAWPPEPAPDPWLSRPMRMQMQLATLDEMLGLAAHDFYQFATQHKIYLTRAAFAGGAPTLPNRWWQRLQAYVQACGLNEDILEDGDLLRAAMQLDAAPNFVPAPRPAPTPDRRPRRYSPSSIEALSRNPYEFYARYILNLHGLPELNEPADASDEGELLHDIFHEFTKAHPDHMPTDAARILNDLAAPRLSTMRLSPLEMDFAWQNFHVARDNFLRWQNAALAAGHKTIAFEHDLSCEFATPAGPVQLTARADRIDQDAIGNFIIVDYKRKNAPSKTDSVNFTRPQLLVEAWLLAQSGKTIAGAEFWPLLANDADIIVPDAEDFAEALALLPERLAQFIAHYLDPKSPFIAAVPGKSFDDQKKYLNLSHAGEWQGRAA